MFRHPSYYKKLKEFGKRGDRGKPTERLLVLSFAGRRAAKLQTSRRQAASFKRQAASFDSKKLAQTRDPC